LVPNSSKTIASTINNCQILGAMMNVLAIIELTRRLPGIGLLAAAAGLFFQPRQAEAPLQLVQHGLRLQVHVFKHDQTVKPQIGGFINDLICVAALGRNDGFSSFLANLLQNSIKPFFVLARNVGGFRIGVLALLQYLGQTEQDITHEIFHTFLADL
jgi:hypothetical protein